VTDLPPGEWSSLLVGHQWPTQATIGALVSAATNRSTIGTVFDEYADRLAAARVGPLGQQEGVTAHDARNAFQRGESAAREIARQNIEKQSAYELARGHVSELRTQLSDIARAGDAEIQSIQSSEDPLPAKFAKIVSVVSSSQAEANIKAAAQADNIFGAIQKILNATDNGHSAREFAKAQGLDAGNDYNSPSDAALEKAVKDNLEKNGGPSSRPSIHSGDAASQSALYAGETPPLQNPKPAPENSAQDAFYSAEGSPPLNSETPQLNVDAADQKAFYNSESSAPIGANTQPLMPGGVLPGAIGTASAPPTGGSSPPVVQSANSAFSSAPSTFASAPSSTSALSPEGLAQNFNAGSQAGAPVSAGTEALSSGAMHAAQPQAPLHTEPMTPAPIASTAPTSGMPLFETAHAATPVDAPPPVAPPPDATQTVVATPAAPAAPAMQSTAAAPPIAPAGPLPAYGADLRPAAATAPAAPPPMPSATPGSAPVNPANASSPSQPAVVRQQPTTTPTPSAAGLTENAFTATATGAAAGAGAAQTQAQQRLQRLLDAVARQEPKLRWTIGDRDDGTTVLITDLASGWIPPHVEIPTGVTLLSPTHRRPDLSAMLGETTLTAAYTPGQYIPAAEDVDPVPMSIRARQTTDVEELGWELAQATKWRDGLPRLAHTLAKAVSAGTGYLDSEVDLLCEQLATVTKQVLTDYPDSVDPVKVGNWQLLATIDALIKNEKTSANYHLAWFQTLNLAVRGEQRR
jgi:hypothetical protein